MTKPGGFESPPARVEGGFGYTKPGRNLLVKAYKFKVFVLVLSFAAQPAYGSVIADSSHPLR
jgi:hypothetical protein